MTDVQDNVPQADGDENKENTAVQNESTPAVEDSTVTETPEDKGEEKTTEPEKLEEVVAENDTPIHELSDDELEGEDAQEEVVSDEDDDKDDFSDEELALPDYATYSPEALITEAEKLFKEQAVHRIKAHMDSIRMNLLKHLNDEKKERLAAFIEDGGVEMDFEIHQPLRDQLRKVYSAYRASRQKYYDDLQQKLEDNLKVKQAIIEKIKDIVTKDESIGDTFKEFNELQQEWKNTGPVPRNESNDLWRTYHHHVENFYEFIKINKELRDLDFKKNHEAKEAIITKAEKLVDTENIKEAFSALQKLHKEWKHLGPVEREHREPMWERFSEATKKLHDKREAYYKELEVLNKARIAEKRELVNKLKEFPFENIKSHAQWQKAIKAVDTVREAFKKIGRINHPDNDVIWEEFREVLRHFNQQKNQFYKELKKEQHDNLERKQKLLAIAEQIKDSDNWKETTNEMKRIQAEWKKIGHVPRSESDKIWKQFRSACNHYFNRLTDFNKELDKSFEDNFIAKEALLAKLKEFKPLASQKESIKALKEIINEWKQLGRVPRDKMHIDNDFNTLLDNQFKAIDLDRQESQKIRFENKMSSIAEQGGDRSLKIEREQMYRKIDDAKKELTQLETNMNFFTSSSSNNPLIKEVEKKVKQQQEIIANMQEKVKMLNVKIKELTTATEKPEEAKEESPEENIND